MYIQGEAFILTQRNNSFRKAQIKKSVETKVEGYRGGHKMKPSNLGPNHYSGPYGP